MSLWKSRKPDTSFDTEAPNEAETAEAHLSGYLFGWMRRAKRSTLPSPLPIMATDAAQWWLATMCPKPPMMIDGDDKENARLHSSHIASCRSSLRGFLSLTTHQRQGVVNMCADGGLKLSYRGESFQQFVSIAEEADRRHTADPFRPATASSARQGAAEVIRADALSGWPPKTPQTPPAVGSVPGQGETSGAAFLADSVALLGHLDMSTVDTTPGARCALAPPAGVELDADGYTDLMRHRYRSSPAHRTQMAVFARRIGYTTITGPWADEARKILERIGP